MARTVMRNISRVVYVTVLLSLIYFIINFATTSKRHAVLRQVAMYTTVHVTGLKAELVENRNTSVIMNDPKSWRTGKQKQRTTITHGDTVIIESHHRTSKNTDDVILHRQTSNYGINLSYVFTDNSITQAKSKNSRKTKRKKRKRLQPCQSKHGLFCMAGNNGRLGNSMYLYSALFALSKRMNMVPKLDSQLFDKFSRLFKMTSQFVKSVNFAHDCQKMDGVGGGHHCKFDYTAFSRIIDPRACDLKLSGFYQSWLYFYENIDEIRSDFTFETHITEKAQQTLVRLTGKIYKSSQITYVGIHVRRGDMASPKLTEFGQLIPPIYYYHNAMLYFTKRYPNVVFVVTSDDKTWCSSVLGKLATKHNFFLAISDQESPSADMALLGQCNHTVMSVGTYGLWVSMLSQGEVVYYPMSSKLLSAHDHGYSPHKQDYYMPYWIPMF